MRTNIVKIAPSEDGQPVRSETILIDGDTARNWRDTKHFERQRPLSSNNIQRLATEMREGRFTPGTQIYLCKFPNGAEVIVNGNHTLESIAVSRVSQMITVTRLNVPDINAAGKVYATFDMQKRRSIMDSVRAYGIPLAFRSSSTFAAAVNAINLNFYQEGSQSQRSAVSHDTVISMMGEYTDQAKDLSAILDRSPRDCMKLIKRAVIMAVALVTLRHQPSLAYEFWDGIARDNGLEKDTPEHTFLRYFRNDPAGRSRMLWGRAAALAWNAKFRKEPLSVIRPMVFTNFRILGTPFDKGIPQKTEKDQANG